MARKGVSPVVSVVLMVVLAVVVGVAVTLWVSGWVTRETTSPSLTCSLHTKYVIDSAAYTNSTNELVVKITNQGTQELYNFGMVLDNGTKILQFNYNNVYQSGINSTNPLRTQESIYLKLNSTYGSLSGENITSALGRTLSFIRITNGACASVPADTTTITPA